MLARNMRLLRSNCSCMAYPVNGVWSRISQIAAFSYRKTHLAITLTL